MKLVQPIEIHRNPLKSIEIHEKIWFNSQFLIPFRSVSDLSQVTFPTWSATAARCAPAPRRHRTGCCRVPAARRPVMHRSSGAVSGTAGMRFWDQMAGSSQSGKSGGSYPWQSNFSGGILWKPQQLLGMILQVLGCRNWDGNSWDHWDELVLLGWFRWFRKQHLEETMAVHGCTMLYMVFIIFHIKKFGGSWTSPTVVPLGSQSLALEVVHSLVAQPQNWNGFLEPFLVGLQSWASLCLEPIQWNWSGLQESATHLTILFTLWFSDEQPSLYPLFSVTSA